MTSRTRRYLGLIIWLGFSGVCGVVLTLGGVFLYLNPQVPAAATYRHYEPETPLRVFTRDGALMAEFGERRLIPVSLEDVPRHFVDGLLSTEDKRFYEHGGIDYISLANDIIRLVLNPEVRTGASTITMQLAKNVSLSLEQTFIRKFKEMLLAIKIEQELTKDEILELYINIVAYGKRAYGAQAAAYTYYGKPLAELDLAQLAMLAGIPKRPEAGNPINGPDWALRRRNLVLLRMFEQGSIDYDAFTAARAAPITAEVHQRELDLSAPYPAEWVRRELVRRYGTDVYSSGYEVYTTLDAGQQVSAKRALRNGLIGYDMRHGYRGVEGHVNLADQGQLGNNADPAEGNRLAEELGLELPIEPEAAGDAAPDPRTPIYLGALQKVAAVADLIPAVVTHLEEQAFIAITKAGEVAIVEWKAMKWARPYIDTDHRGDTPKAASDILAVGDIIRVQRAGEDSWRLVQIPEIEGALVAIRPGNGAIAALVGGFDFSRSQFNHVLQAARQPGSGFKPFVYSAALASGVTPASIFLDAPLVFDDATLEMPYRPRNDNSRFNGPTRLREALYKSINLVSMRVLIEVGAGEVLNYVRRFGFDTAKFPRNTQLAIGGGTMEVTPLNMAKAYAVLANQGYTVQPHIIDRVETQDGTVIFEPRYPQVCDPCDEPEPIEGAPTTNPIIPAPRAVDERNVFILNSMLQDVIKRGTGRRAGVLERADLAGKTGTTNEAADTWFNGYNRHLVTTVWVGFDDHRPIGEREYGSNTPLPIWIEFMRTALDGQSETAHPQPEGVITVKIDPQTGRAARPDQDGAIFEYFLAEHMPARDDNRRTKVVMPDDEVSPEDIF